MVGDFAQCCNFQAPLRSCIHLKPAYPFNLVAIYHTMYGIVNGLSTFRSVCFILTVPYNVS